QRPDYCGFARRLPPALPALVMPVLILGSIYGGFLTPTEVSAVALVYAIFLGVLVYRSATLTDIWRSGQNAVMQSCMIFLVIIGGNILSFMLTRLGIASDIAAFFRDSGMTKVQFLFMVNVLLFI